jgi:hypothetical protein
MIFASLQGAGKWQSRGQWLNKCVKCTIGLLGICRRYSFPVQSSKSLLVLGSTVIIGIGVHMCFEMGPLLRRKERSVYSWSLLVYWGVTCHWLTNQSVAVNCYWPCPARQFLVPRSTGLMNKYCFLTVMRARLFTLSYPFLSESESELLYDWRFTGVHLDDKPIETHDRNIIFFLTEPLR